MPTGGVPPFCIVGVRDKRFKANGGVAPVRLALNGEPASPVLFPASLFPDLMGLKGKDGGSSLLSG